MELGKIILDQAHVLDDNVINTPATVFGHHAVIDGGFLAVLHGDYGAHLDAGRIFLHAFARIFHIFAIVAGNLVQVSIEKQVGKSVAEALFLIRVK